MLNEEMKCEYNRLATFNSDWPHTFITPRILAKIGFFYIGPYDRVKCNFCRIYIENWEINDVEISEHIKWSPYCPLLNQDKTSNIPIEPVSELNKLLSTLNIHQKSDFDTNMPLVPSVSNKTTTTTTASNVQILQQIRFPEFATKIARLKSYNNWPGTKRQKPEQLSEAGFFHTRKKDRIVCFSCGGSLCNWSEQDDPWEQHALHYANCDFLCLIKGPEYIKTIATKTQNRQIESMGLNIRHMKNNCLLNDKVMLDIFKYFGIKNLVNVAQVSLQFEKLAISTFGTKYKHFMLNNRSITAGDNNLITIFKTFGNVMQSVSTPSKSYPWYERQTQKLIILLIKKYCSNDSLQCLKLYNFSSIKRYFILMDDVFVNLKILHLDYAALPFSILQLINKLPQINDLQLKYCIPIFPITQSIQPNVNLNLQKLTIRCRNRFFTLDVLAMIHLLYPNITEFKFQTIGNFNENRYKFNDALRNIGQLEHLTILDIDIDCEPMENLISPLITNGRQIKQLCIRYPEISTYALNCLSELNEINQLHITNVINKHRINMTDLIAKFPNLRSVSIIDIPITVEELYLIVRTAQHLMEAEFKMANSIMNIGLLQRMKYLVEKRENRQPLKLVLHINGQNEIDEYKNYIKHLNQSNSLFFITLTHKGENILVVPNI